MEMSLRYIVRQSQKLLKASETDVLCQALGSVDVSGDMPRISWQLFLKDL